MSEIAIVAGGLMLFCGIFGIRYALKNIKSMNALVNEGVEIEAEVKSLENKGQYMVLTYEFPDDTGRMFHKIHPGKFDAEGIGEGSKISIVYEKGNPSNNLLPNQVQNSLKLFKILAAVTAFDIVFIVPAIFILLK